MPRISKYELDGSLSDNDKLLGSDEAGNTKNFKLKDVANFVAESGGVFKHHQNNTSATWTITHNLDLEDYLPHVNVKLSGGGSFNKTLIKSLTNWEPIFGGIEGFKKGLLKTSEWFSDPTNLKKYKPNKYSI